MQLLISCQPFPSISTFTLSRNARFPPICWDAAPLAHSSCPCLTNSPPTTTSHLDSCCIQVELWTIVFWLKRQIRASGASMCSVWWAASGCWSFFQYRSPPSSLLFSSLYLASWPLQRSLLSFFTSEGGRILESALHIYKLSCFATSNTYTHFFRFWHCTTIYSFHIFHCNAILWNQM